MGRKDKYPTHVEPYLDDITKWYSELTEEQIAQKLGVSVQSFERYKAAHEELVQALRKGKENLVGELKASLKMKAKGFHYKETKTTIRKDGDRDIKVVEQYEKYSAPDTGAIHLLLKNLDPEWHNDDKRTMDMKQAQIDIARMKAEMEEW